VKRALVTGAARGIGFALAERLGLSGYGILGVDRDARAAFAAAETLRAKRIAIGFEILDLGDRPALDALVERLAPGPPFDLVVQNAGISCTGRFEGADPARLAEVISVNLESPLVLTAGLLRSGRIAPGGTLVFVSSLSHFVGYPGAAVYAATKDGIASYARSLSVALAPRGTRVLTVFPGPVRTEHAERHAPRGSDPTRRMDPALLAARIEAAVRDGKSRLIPSLGLRIAAWAGRTFPRAVDRAMKKALLDRLDRDGAGESAPRPA
jgi:hypothetical protein